MTPMSAMRQGALTLGIFALFTAGSVALTRAMTAERINDHREAYQQRQLLAVLPQAIGDVPVAELLDSTFALPDPALLGHRSPTTGWRVSHGTLQALVLPVTTRQGYSGEIDLLVGMQLEPDTQPRISGVRVTYHQETPGLGDKIEAQRSDWITHFNGLRLADLPPESWAVRKDGGQFDGFTGATITPRAVIKAVHDALVYAEHLPLVSHQQEPTP
ncbi:RnfABCDGE type electron transport complex subunit G [Halomonas aquamarina]|uniref:RnfABCDGE type electron transport complex subunit G n=1 Tax=Vreelandella aquamarina TaxID=77097 RepID=A0ACC5VVL0_9GAMM|nr:RnfABCDGE type electron transport complex subunit G [Halomonas aquamarina]MBZ5487964.1 RnfABCDGE type electron transport complex subunit G [Halomonas aquamarina]